MQQHGTHWLQLIGGMILFVLLGLVSWRSSQAAILQSGAGLMMVEESDDIMHPGAMVYGSSEAADFRLFHWGRNFGPVQERSWLGTVTKRFSLSQVVNIQASTGLALLSEQTKIRYSEVNSAYNFQETKYNLGFSFGLYLDQEITKGWDFSLGWESALFPAGFAALFLVTARKTVIFSAVGYQW